MKYPLLLIAIILFFGACKGQPKTELEAKQLYNADFKWRITIPENFNAITPTDFAKIQQKGLDAVEKTQGQKVINQAKLIFAFRSDQFNYFEANQQPYDLVKDGNYIASCRAVDGVLYDTFKKQFPAETKIDSAMSTEVINKQVFQRVIMNIGLPNNMTMKMYMFNRLFDKKELTISIVYIDEIKGKKLLDAFRTSKFE